MKLPAHITSAVANLSCSVASFDGAEQNVQAARAMELDHKFRMAIETLLSATNNDCDDIEWTEPFDIGTIN